MSVVIAVLWLALASVASSRAICGEFLAMLDEIDENHQNHAAVQHDPERIDLGSIPDIFTPPDDQLPKYGFATEPEADDDLLSRTAPLTSTGAVVRPHPAPASMRSSTEESTGVDPDSAPSEGAVKIVPTEQAAANAPEPISPPEPVLSPPQIVHPTISVQVTQTPPPPTATIAHDHADFDNDTIPSYLDEDESDAGRDTESFASSQQRDGSPRDPIPNPSQGAAGNAPDSAGRHPQTPPDCSRRPRDAGDVPPQPSYDYPPNSNVIAVTFLAANGLPIPPSQAAPFTNAVSRFHGPVPHFADAWKFITP